MAKKEETTVEEAVVAVDPRQERWEAFLVKARKVNPERFDAQKEAGEFDVIPDSFE